MLLTVVIVKRRNEKDYSLADWTIGYHFEDGKTHVHKLSCVFDAAMPSSFQNMLNKNGWWQEVLIGGYRVWRGMFDIKRRFEVEDALTD